MDDFAGQKSGFMPRFAFIVDGITNAPWSMNSRNPPPGLREDPVQSEMRQGLIGEGRGCDRDRGA
jgi:hypothetical protein